MVARHSETPDRAVVPTAISDLKSQIGAVDVRADLLERDVSSAVSNKANFGLFGAKKGHSWGKQSQSGPPRPTGISDPFDRAQDGCADLRAQIAGREPPGGVSSFVQSKPNFVGGQNVYNFRTCKHLNEYRPVARAPKHTQSKPIFQAGRVAMDGAGIARYNDSGAGAKDRLGQRECLR
ncbi:MAG: hypothetical protein JSW27_05105 [Phycisphaerales bacterium]|nr:MAG: hypothetical protein JSW27_05105 [Phycisphaerales bacterium]